MNPDTLRMLLQLAFWLTVGISVACFVHDIREHKSGRRQKSALEWFPYAGVIAGIATTTEYIFPGRSGKMLESVANLAFLYGGIVHLITYKEFWKQSFQRRTQPKPEMKQKPVKEPERERIANR